MTAVPHTCPQCGYSRAQAHREREAARKRAWCDEYQSLFDMGLSERDVAEALGYDMHSASRREAFRLRVERYTREGLL